MVIRFRLPCNLFHTVLLSRCNRPVNRAIYGQNIRSREPSFQFLSDEGIFTSVPDQGMFVVCHVVLKYIIIKLCPKIIEFDFVRPIVPLEIQWLFVVVSSVWSETLAEE